MHPLRWKLWIWMVFAVPAAAAAAVLFFCDPVRVPIYPQCIFHQLTGLDCPGCGSLRAVHALLHGQWRAALHFNAFLVLSLPLLAVGGWSLLRQPRHPPMTSGLRGLWWWLYFAAFLSFGILRDLPGTPFAAFAP